MKTGQLNSNVSLENERANEKCSTALSLDEFDPFKGLTPAIIDSLGEMADFRHYASGETIISHGQYEGEVFFLVAKGKIKISTINPITGAILMETVEQGNSFGIDIVLAQNNEEVVSNITLNAIEDSQLWVVDAYTFNELIVQRPSVAKNILYYVATQVMQSRLRSFEFKTSPEVAVFSNILSSASYNEVSGCWLIEQMPKHRELAEISGVEEADAANAIAVLIQEKIARRDYPGLIIDDMTKLEKLTS